MADLTTDDVLTALYLRASKVLRDEETGPNDFEEYLGEVEDMVPLLKEAHERLQNAIDLKVDQSEIDDLATALYNATLYMAMGAAFTLGRFPALDRVKEAMPGQLPELSLDDGEVATA